MKRSGAAIAGAFALEVVPAAIFGGAAGFAVSAVLGQAPLSASALAGGAAAFGCAWLVLRRLGASGSKLHLPAFDVEAFEPDGSGAPEEALEELMLEDEAAAPPAGDELVLEDTLQPLGEDSRVVRLFSPESNPTAGELHARIERHLRTAPRQSMPDATQELHEALAALRQSLR